MMSHAWFAAQNVPLGDADSMIEARRLADARAAELGQDVEWHHLNDVMWRGDMPNGQCFVLVYN
jgi:hypothetical protein